MAATTGSTRSSLTPTTITSGCVPIAASKRTASVGSTTRPDLIRDARRGRPVSRGAAGNRAGRRLSESEQVARRQPSIWETARFDPTEHNGFGWIGRALDEAPSDSRRTVRSARRQRVPPVTLRGRRSIAATLESRRHGARRDPAIPRDFGAANECLAAFVRRSTLDR